MWDGLFSAIFKKDFKGIKHCHITGMRAEESPRRFMGMTQGLTYKWITWGTRECAPDNHYSFHPIYDWTYGDIWKAINDHDWTYNPIYDLQHRHGVGIPNMRISNLHHETAVRSLFYLQEFDKDLILISRFISIYYINLNKGNINI